MSRFGGAPRVGAPPRNTTCCALHAAPNPDELSLTPISACWGAARTCAQMPSASASL
ncbi:hypothetical protein NW848_05100 [Synechococcus sp. RC10A2]